MVDVSAVVVGIKAGLGTEPFATAMCEPFGDDEWDKFMEKFGRGRGS